MLAMAMLVASSAFAQDVLTIGASTANPGSPAQVPVYIRDAGGTPLGSDAGAGNRIQGFAFKVTCSPSNAVTSVSFARAGVVQNLTPLYERTLQPSAGLVYLGSFAESSNAIPFNLNAAPPGDQVGTLSVTVSGSATAGTQIALTIDAPTAILANQAGTVGETTGNGALSVVSGSVTVNGAATTTTLGSSPNPANAGQTVTFTATVSSLTAGTITGSVTFKDGSTTLGSGTVSGGQATYGTSALSPGTHSITAVYSGDSTFSPSTSVPLSQTINATGPPSAVASIIATAASATLVNVSWPAAAGADHYELYRSSNNGAFGIVATPAGTAVADTVSAGVTYLYKVHAVNSFGAGADSPIDAATTIVFTDDPIVAGTTVVQAVHLLELRAAVNAFRAAAGLPAATFTDDLSTPTFIQAVHVNQLRAALAEAFAQLHFTMPTLTDSLLTAGMPVKAAHLQELRNAVK